MHHTSNYSREGGGVLPIRGVSVRKGYLFHSFSGRLRAGSPREKNEEKARRKEKKREADHGLVMSSTN